MVGPSGIEPLPPRFQRGERRPPIRQPHLEHSLLARTRRIELPTFRVTGERSNH